ncbi:MAG: DNA/RNA nuclease SfsA [Clostridia bacterium]|nr:DNA/RNA nuclease SfsA [Clostridia bacterium]
MKYANIKQGKFIDRPNRFIAHIDLDGTIAVCHVKNTGRCKELLLPGATVFVEKSENPARKTQYDLIAVCKGDRLINIDSQAPNQVIKEWIPSFFSNLSLVKPEAKYGDSRFDFYLEANGKKIFAEVKGVTLEDNGVVLFPDAPTERGVKHLHELCHCIQYGYDAYLFFVVQMEKADYFTPNRRTHPAFADALAKAERQGVNLICVTCDVTPDTLAVKNFLPIKL